MKNIHRLSAPRPVSMNEEWFEYAQSDHFWMKWRLDALARIRHHLPGPGARILDIGCGRGQVLEHLERAYEFVADGCDLDIDALKQAPANLAGELYLYDVCELQAEMLGKYEAVFLLDIVEHIEDDATFLRASAEHLMPGAALIINVPAYQTLFSVYDTILGHRRRYTRSALAQLIRKAGLEPVVVHYWGAPLIPFLVARKTILNFVPSENRVKMGFEPPNQFMHSILHFLRRAEGAIPYAPPMGTSVLAVAIKRN